MSSDERYDGMRSLADEMWTRWERIAIDAAEALDAEVADA